MIPGLRINYATFPLKDGSNGVLAVLLYVGDKDPRKILDWAVKEFTKDCDIPYVELIDATLSYPWVRVIISNVDEMQQYTWTEFLTMNNRDKKINDILNGKIK